MNWQPLEVLDLSGRQTSELEALIDQARQHTQANQETSYQALIKALHAVGELWHSGGAFYQAALSELSQELSFAPSMIELSLNLIPDILNEKNLFTRLQADFENPQVLDEYTDNQLKNCRIRAYPRGLLLHVTAGNVFLGLLDTVVMGLITKNVNLIKLSGKNHAFPRLLMQSFAQLPKAQAELLLARVQMLSWPGGDEAIESLFKTQMDGILVWGGEAVQKSYQQNLGLGVKLFDYGPKISLQVLSEKWLVQQDEAGLEKLATKIAQDICLWDQAACASPQNLFYPASQARLIEQQLMPKLKKAIEAYPHPRGSVDAEDQVEWLKTLTRAQLQVAQGLGSLQASEKCLLIQEPGQHLKPAPLGRSLLLKPYDSFNELQTMLIHFNYYLQSCGYACDASEEAELCERLGASGIKRMTPMGSMLVGTWGAPHDGRKNLLELTNLSAQEYGSDRHELKIQRLLYHAVTEVPYYREQIKCKPGQGLDLADFPLLSGQILQQYPISQTQHLLSSKLYQQGGAIYASGGTSGKPKYAFYTHQEFAQAAECLAQGFRACGLKAGMKVANLFVAGNFWSSFRAVEEALKVVGAIELPIGGLSDPNDILHYLETFKPDAVMGLPSLLMEYANLSLKKASLVKVPQIFFAGEKMHAMAEHTLKRAWQVESFHSAGYASVDVGPIGYATSDCGTGEHYLFEDLHLEIIEHEAVVTSLFRQAMPIIRYRTGDRVELIGPATDQSPAKFKLLGRLDGQLQVWSCKFYLADIEQVLNRLFPILPVYQVHVQTHTDNSGQLEEQLSIHFKAQDRPSASVPLETFIAELHEQCPDLKQSYPLSFFEHKINWHWDRPLNVIKRTGKTPQFVDHR